MASCVSCPARFHQDCITQSGLAGARLGGQPDLLAGAEKVDRVEFRHEEPSVPSARAHAFRSRAYFACLLMAVFFVHRTGRADSPLTGARPAPTRTRGRPPCATPRAAGRAPPHTARGRRGAPSNPLLCSRARRAAASGGARPCARSGGRRWVPSPRLSLRADVRAGGDGVGCGQGEAHARAAGALDGAACERVRARRGARRARCTEPRRRGWRRPSAGRRWGTRQRGGARPHHREDHRAGAHGPEGAHARARTR